jgi:hypothetical protein
MHQRWGNASSLELAKSEIVDRLLPATRSHKIEGRRSIEVAGGFC